MLCSEGPSLRLADRALTRPDLEQQLDFSYIYERKAHYEQTTDASALTTLQELECKCLCQEVASRNHCSICTVHKDFFPSLEAIDEEQSELEDTSKVVAELGMKYDLSLPDKHYNRAKNLGYLQQRKGRRYRRKVFTKENTDFPRRERSVTF